MYACLGYVFTVTKSGLEVQRYLWLELAGLLRGFMNLRFRA